jgi:hypothetical protein
MCNCDHSSLMSVTFHGKPGRGLKCVTNHVRNSENTRSHKKGQNVTAW